MFKQKHYDKVTKRNNLERNEVASWDSSNYRRIFIVLRQCIYFELVRFGYVFSFDMLAYTLRLCEGGVGGFFRRKNVAVVHVWPFQFYILTMKQSIAVGCVPPAFLDLRGGSTVFA